MECNTVLSDVFQPRASADGVKRMRNKPVACISQDLEVV